MAVRKIITIDLDDCPECLDPYLSLVELLAHTVDNIDKTLDGFNLTPKRQLGNITVYLPCGATCTFLWHRGLAIINKWTC